MTESTPTIFIAYSHKDKEHLEELRTFISPLIRNKRVSVWFDGEIRAGSVWDVEIKKALHNADIILLLVSPNSLNSDYFYEKEVADALERHTKNQARVIPIILNPCLWDDTPLHEIQVLPKGARPISEWPNKNSAWDDVARGIKNAVEEINNLKTIAEQKQIAVQKIKEKEEAEAKAKANQERIRIEKENKVKEFYAAISDAEKFEKEELWPEAEVNYRKSLVLWENPAKPTEEKLLAKITYCISKQNSKDNKDTEMKSATEPFSNSSEINKEGEARHFWSFFAWSLFAIAFLWTFKSYKQEHKEKEFAQQQVSRYVSKFPILIDDISATITDEKGKELLGVSSHELFADSVKYLTPVIEYRAYTSINAKLLVKVIQPDGTIRRGEKSPPNGSYEYEFYCSTQPYFHRSWARIGGWGYKIPNYSKGYYLIEIWYQNNCLGSNTIILK